jgi:hypothetical protein
MASGFFYIANCPMPHFLSRFLPDLGGFEECLCAASIAIVPMQIKFEERFTHTSGANGIIH